MDAERMRGGIITPEAIVLEFETAGVGSRLVAKLVDLLVMVVAVYAGVLAFASIASGFSETIAIIFVVVFVFLLLFGYPIGSEVLLGGRTIGKMAVGLRVVTIEGAPITFRHASIRGLLGLIDLYLTVGAAAALSTLLSPQNQRLGDLAAGTIVLRERTADGVARAVQFPIPWGQEAWVHAMDTSRLTDAHYGLVREYLLRAKALSYEARWSVGNRLAHQVAVQLGHGPPPNTIDSETYLGCVAAAYQLRHRRTARVDLGLA